MTDLVERLRTPQVYRVKASYGELKYPELWNRACETARVTWELRREAADEIERLRNERDAAEERANIQFGLTVQAQRDLKSARYEAEHAWRYSKITTESLVQIAKERDEARAEVNRLRYWQNA
jgi:hypothetical protein